MVLLRIHLAVSAAFTAYNLLNLLLIMARYTYSPLVALRVFSSMALSIIFFLSAIIYFSVSERVRATYGARLFG
jgi:intracellular septation protein A